MKIEAKTVYRTVDECIDSLRECLPILLLAKENAERSGHKEILKEVNSLLNFLQDTDLLRKALSKVAREDGSIVFSFTPEALNAIRTEFGQGSN